jgi:hypothetical protein
MVAGLIYPLPVVCEAICAGVEFLVGSNFKLTGDIRYVFLNYNFKEFPGSSDMNSNFYVLTVGFLYSL